MKRLLPLALLTLGLLATPTLAADGSWQVRMRTVEVLPDATASVTVVGGSVDITDTLIPEIDITYFFDDHWAVETIAGSDKHAIYHSSGLFLGNAWLLPPTITLQYHFDPIGFVQPYVGAGPNYTFFYDVDSGALGVPDLKNRFGFALQAGFDIPFGEDGYFFNVDVKKLFLSTKASFSGSAVTAKVDIDPWLIGVGFGVRF